MTDQHLDPVRITQASRRHDPSEAVPAQYRVLSPRAITVGALTIVAVAVGMTVWLLAAFTGGNVDANQNHLDAIRTAGTVVVGAGGAVALLLAARRQRATEIALNQKDRDQELLQQANTVAEDDATERRVTELYTKAADQLGSDKAPVRLAGLYALERLAQDHIKHRQTIVNVLCAYLRMPYTPPGDDINDKSDTEYQERLQEREVRTTAQRILADHLRPVDTSSGSEDLNFWPGVKINLEKATLVNCGFGSCAIDNASFKGATFIGSAWFVHASLRNVVFSHATFNDIADFQGAAFDGGIVFYGSVFQERAWFMNTTFTHTDGYPVGPFDNVAFCGEVRFEEATMPASHERHRTWKATVSDRHNGEHVWPSTWRIEADLEGDGGTLVEADNGNDGARLMTS